MKERISIDLYHVVDRLIQELKKEFRLSKDATPSEDTPNAHAVLNNFLFKLFERFHAVLSGHCYFIDFSATLAMVF
jgi:hypothetical protein